MRLREIVSSGSMKDLMNGRWMISCWTCQVDGSTVKSQTFPNRAPCLDSTLRPIRWKFRSKIFLMRIISSGSTNSSAESTIIPRRENSRTLSMGRISPTSLPTSRPVTRQAIILRSSGSIMSSLTLAIRPPTCKLRTGQPSKREPLNNILLLYHVPQK